MKGEKLRIAIGLGATCSGCDIAILDINERILELAEIADIVFWPPVMDGKFHDLEEMDEIDVAIFHGSLKMSHHVKTAKILREKAKYFVAFGACACFGGVFGLFNIRGRERVLDDVYPADDPHTGGVRPLDSTEIIRGADPLEMPRFLDWVQLVPDHVKVDLWVPGCPPVAEQMNTILGALKTYHETGKLPPSGTVLAGETTLCEECPREKPETVVIERLYRPHEKKLDEEKCFLSQGVICVGPVTRSGCGELCIRANSPCRGCFGPMPGVKDMGAKAISSISSIVQMHKEGKIPEDEVGSMVENYVDTLGTFYRFTLPSSYISRSLKHGGGDK